MSAFHPFLPCSAIFPLSPYREHVRQIVPEEIQDAIRAKCTDKPIPDKPLTVRLPPTCDLDFPEFRFVSAAAALRSHPELVGELRWHRSAVAAFLDNLRTVHTQTQQLQRAIERTA